MKKLAISILVIAAVIAGIGFYRGWFLVDQTRIERDEKAAKREVDDIGKQVKEKANDLTRKDRD
jgi:hypothetical protein